MNEMLLEAIDAPEDSTDYISSIVSQFEEEEYWNARLDAVLRNILRGMNKSEKEFSLRDVYRIFREDGECREEFVETMRDEGQEYVPLYVAEIREIETETREIFLGRLQPYAETIEDRR